MGEGVESWEAEGKGWNIDSGGPPPLLGCPWQEASESSQGQGEVMGERS